MIFAHDPYSRTNWFSEQLMKGCGATSDDYVFVETLGMGDHVNSMRVIGGIAQKLKENGSKIYFWVSQRNLLLQNYFPTVFDGVFSPSHPNGPMVDWGPMDYQVNCLAERNIRQKGSPLILSFDSYSDGWLGKLFRADKISLTDVKRLLLNLPFDSPLLPLSIPSANRAKHIENAQSQGLTPNSIIVFNHQWNQNGFGEALYAELIKKFPGRVFYDLGYGAANEKKINGARPLRMQLDEIISFAEYAGTVVALRSGITDLLSSSSINLFSIYPSPLKYEDYGEVDDHCHATHQYLERMDMAPKGFEKRIHVSKIDPIEIGARLLVQEVEKILLDVAVQT